MSSANATASTSAAPTGAAAATASKKDLPHLLPLEEDDEFEEFAAEDWEDKDTFGATLQKSGTSAQATGAASAANGAATSSSSSTGKGLDSLWEDNWDDDDVGDDFSVQLR
ncbi:hypothetical protein OIV83_003339 [Microbotryomycetes sp. JL201]|nr:hypothetical protein OIV83_003339 [Microbotryomycetes sp. JL201]